MTLKLELSELDGMTGLMKEQADHFGDLAVYASTTCRDTKGFGYGLMHLMIEPVHRVADWARGSLASCQAKMDGDVGNLKVTKQVYADNEVQGEQRFHTLYPGVVGAKWYSDFNGKVPNLVVNYHDQWAKPEQPADTAGADLDAQIGERHRNLQQLQRFWHIIKPQQDLAQILTEPIIGDYSRFGWLAEAWSNLGNATYDIAGNLRRGTLKIGGGWSGEAARAFEYHMFNWHMGVGGVGDTHQIVSMELKWIGEKASQLANAILLEIDHLINWWLRKIADYFMRYPRLEEAYCSCKVDDVLPEPERLEFFKAITKVIEKIEVVKKKIQEMEEWFRSMAKKITDLVGAIMDTVRDPGSLARGVRNTIDKKMNQAVTIEKHGEKFDPKYWNPRMGAWRMLMLPQ